MSKLSGSVRQKSLAAQMAQLAVEPWVAAGKALVKAGFIFANHPKRPHHAYGLNVAQVDVLATLARAEETGLRCSEIAEKTLITKGGITGILYRLEVRGLIKRAPSHDDRRSVLVRLSTKGVEVCCKFFPELARGNRETFARAFTPEQMEQFSKLLSLLLCSLEADTGKTLTRASELSHEDRWI